ncbi:MAG: hypothetical protein Homavirus33_4 [Homavirus sp.]|uniref:Uncharacterized protein n=1 Tax=Homavirus sp. TaxID=2487769 RepID=A0A3G5A5P1_9VIRU|nr:MAG: hypothetical protein Homavirus33_4 [Homavirus sp.]
MEKVNFYNITPELKVSKKIALVGNSNSLLSGKYAKMIDSFDDVIRFNYGDLKANITGLKTTIRWINCPIVIESAKEHNKSIVTIDDMNKYTQKLFNNISIICWKSLQDKMSPIDSTFKFYTPNEYCTLGNINGYLETLGVKHRFTVVENCWPRTGFQAVLTCIRSGCVPHLFGFDIECHKIIKHYSLATNYSVAHMTQHQIDNEVIILNELKNMGLIIVHR